MIISVLGMLNENGTGVQQVEALALRALLGLRLGLGDHDGDVVARGHGVGEPARQRVIARRQLRGTGSLFLRICGKARLHTLANRCATST